jgi:spiro-SPASM protein
MRASMNTIAVVNATDISPYALRPFRDGTSALELAVAAARGLPGVRRVVALTTSGAAGPEAARAAGAEVRPRPTWDVPALFRQLASEAEGFDHVLYLHGDCPFVDLGLAERMFASHLRYYADYTFADGYPLGLAVEILKRGALAPLAKLAELVGGAIARDTVFTVVQKDINAFDLETELSPEDLRSLRLTLAADGRRGFALLGRLEALGARDAAGVAAAVTGHPEILRTFPAYCTVQIVEGCPQLCSYCPYPAVLERRGHRGPGRVDEMPRERFSALLDGVEALCGDAVVSVSLWGEPALHSAAAELLLDAASRPAITLQVETSGVGWSRAVLERVRAEARKPPTWIVSLDAWTPAVYTALRGPGFAEALQSAEILRQLFPTTTHLQVVRMKEHEEDTEAFYRGWKERGAATIIQKYDAFAGHLPDRRVTDLSPLVRAPCWHLKRDLVILLDGTIPMCREELDPAAPLGNAFTDGLAAAWERGSEPYLLHARAQYPEMCSRCDEYYTYNA